MAESPKPGIYLIIEFNWPAEISKEIAQSAKNLHEAVAANDWIEEVVAGSGGLGGGPSSLWIFRLADYAALDRLLKDRHDPVAQAYNACFKHMRDINERIREQVVFL